MTARLVRRLRALGAGPAGTAVAAAVAAAGAAPVRTTVGTTPGPTVEAVRAAYAEREAPVVRQCAWLGQNIRFPLVAIPCILGAPAVFFWLTLVPLTLVLAAVLVVHEGRAGTVLRALDGPPIADPGRAPAGEPSLAVR